MNGNQEASRRFFRMMLVVIALAGIAWLAFEVTNYRGGGKFAWSGVVVFGVALMAFAIPAFGRNRGK